jgi:hypothetical protein
MSVEYWAKSASESSYYLKDYTINLYRERFWGLSQTYYITAILAVVTNLAADNRIL